MNKKSESLFPKRLPWFLDPRTKMCLMIIISSVAMAGDITGARIYPRLFVLLIPSLLFLINKKNKKAIITIILITIAWSIEASIGSFRQNILVISIMMVVGITTRFVAPLLMGSFILYSTQVEEIIYSFEKMKIPHQIVIPFAAMYRFVPTAKEESISIANAMKMRGLNGQFGLKHPLLFVEYRFVPLISSLVKIANDLTISCVTRGLGSPKKRTSIIESKFLYMDLLMIILAITLMGLYYLV